MIISGRAVSYTHLDVYKRQAQFQALGHIRNDKLAEYYSSHDVLMLPSRQDGFGMVLLEAMACGIPIVASHNTGAPDIKKIVSNPDSVTLMEDVSPGALLGAIRYFKEHQATDSSELLSDSEKSYFTWSEYGRR